MTHPLGEEWALDAARRNQIGLHIDHVDPHVPHTAEAILGCGLTELCLPSQIFYESYSATEILLCSALPLPGVKPGSASNLCQLLTGKVESSLLFGLQL